MDKKIEKKVVFEGPYEDVISIDDHYYLVSKKHRICVLPYTISTDNLLDKIGVIKDYNYFDKDYDYTLINGYITSDDETDLVCANRLLFNIIGKNVESADQWAFLGSLFNNLTSDSPISIYAVNISDLQIKTDEGLEEKQDQVKFEMMDCSKVVTTDDSLFLASMLRLFQFQYVGSLNGKF